MRGARLESDQTTGRDLVSLGAPAPLSSMDMQT